MIVCVRVCVCDCMYMYMCFYVHSRLENNKYVFFSIWKPWQKLLVNVDVGHLWKHSVDFWPSAELTWIIKKIFCEVYNENRKQDQILYKIEGQYNRNSQKLAAD